MPRGPQTKAAVISAQGRRDTKIVGALRFGVAVFTGAVLIVLGRLFDGAGTPALIVAGCFGATAAVFAFLETSYGGRAARKEEMRIRRELLERQFAAASNPEADRELYPPARMVEMMTTGAEKTTEFRQVYLGSTIAALLVPLATLVYIGAFIDPVVGFVILALVPLIPLVIGVFLLAVRKSAAFSQGSRGVVTARYLDVIRNLTTIRLHNAGERIGDELHTQAEKNRATLMSMLARNQTMIMLLDSMFALVLVVATVWLTAARASHLTVGEGVTIILLAVLLLEPLQQVSGFFFIGIGAIRSQKEIRSFLTDVPAASTTPADTAADTTPPGPIISTGVNISDVTFDYGRGPVLKDVSLRVAPGERVAILGRSGAGKSTLLGLIRGSIPLQEGAIVIDGYPVNPHTPRATRKLSASVSQSTWMFTGTIADNLRIARPGASEQDMWQALLAAHVAEDVEAMPGGLATDLGEGAIKISGGQAQRISLARGLLSGRKLLLLDEPTSYVDAYSEARIVEAINALPREWTVLMVTHRPSMLAAADRALTLEDGRLTRAEDSLPAEVRNA